MCLDSLKCRGHAGFLGFNWGSTAQSKWESAGDVAAGAGGKVELLEASGWKCDRVLASATASECWRGRSWWLEGTSTYLERRYS